MAAGAASTDGWAEYEIPLVDDTKPVNFIMHLPSGDSVPDTREPGGDRSFVAAAGPTTVWIDRQGDTDGLHRQPAHAVTREHRERSRPMTGPSRRSTCGGIAAAGGPPARRPTREAADRLLRAYGLTPTATAVDGAVRLTVRGFGSADGTR